MTGTIARLEELLKTVPQRLVELADDAVAHKPAPNRWSKKEILGHLIDSAAKIPAPYSPPPRNATPKRLQRAGECVYNSDTSSPEGQ